MQTTTAKLYSLEYNNARTYGFSALFIAGNILLPQLCHTIHLGGPCYCPSISSRLSEPINTGGAWDCSRQYSRPS